MVTVVPVGNALASVIRESITYGAATITGGMLAGNVAFRSAIVPDTELKTVFP